MKLALVGKFPAGAADLMMEQLNEHYEICTCPDAADVEQFWDADCIVLKGSSFTQKSDFEKTPNLKYLQKWGVGLDKVDIAAAGELGIAVANVPGGNAYTVAELAVLHMLNLLRHFPEHNAAMKKGLYNRTEFAKTTFNLRGKLVGLLGGGNIGRLVAERVQVFGAQTQYYDVIRLPSETEEKYHLTFVSKEELFRTSDILSLHVPLTAETHHIVDKAAIDMMKQGAYIINTARGGLLDEAALVDALKSGKIAGAGIDCIEHEPISADDPITQFPNVTLTPHVGATSVDLPRYMVPIIVQDLLDFAEGKAVRSVANRAYLKMK